MMKPLLLVSAIALAAPVLAQTTSTTDSSMDNQTSSSTSSTSANDDTGAMSGNTVNAQNTTGTPDDADDSTTDHSAMGHSTTDTSAVTTGTMDTSSAATSSTALTQSTMASAGQTVQPGNENPERDARGIAVVSDPAFVPAGWNGSSSSAMGGPAEGSDSYPACSASVTDNCTQTYERGRSK